MVCEIDGEVMFSSLTLTEEKLCKANSISDRNILQPAALSARVAP